MPRTRGRFGPELRAGAVRIVAETGKPVAAVARDYRAACLDCGREPAGSHGCSAGAGELCRGDDGQDYSMATTKRKVSISLDEELASALEAGSESLSSQVNEAARVEFTRRRRRVLLDEMLDEFERSEGPVDEALVDNYMELLA